MNIEIRDSLRNSVVELLLATFPGSAKVSGGIAFLSDTVDPETGALIPVEIKVTAKNTQATARSEAYDFEKAVAAFAAKPGKKVADPAKKAEAEAKTAEAAARKAARLAAITEWVNAGNLTAPMTTTDIVHAVFGANTPNSEVMQTGQLLKAMAEDGVLNVALDEKRRKVYTVA